MKYMFEWIKDICKVTLEEENLIQSTQGCVSVWDSDADPFTLPSQRQ